jgi:hypothetical protein
MAWLRIAALILLIGGGLVASRSGSPPVAGARGVAQPLIVDQTPTVSIAVAAGLVLLACPLSVAAAAAGLLFRPATGVLVTDRCRHRRCRVLRRGQVRRRGRVRSTVGDRFGPVLHSVQQHGVVVIACARIAPLSYSLSVRPGGDRRNLTERSSPKALIAAASWPSSHSAGSR